MSDLSAGESQVTVEIDIAKSRKMIRDFSMSLGFGLTDVTRIITATAELARNIYRYAGTGVIHWRKLENGSGIGIELVFTDNGPGIENIEMAMGVGYTTSEGLGLGLPGTKRLMDEMEIQSEIGIGTTVTVRKWLRRSRYAAA